MDVDIIGTNAKGATAKTKVSSTTYNNSHITAITSLILIIVILCNSGCQTTKMWKKKTSYEEVIKNYLISDNGEKIAFLGEKYHYIFDDNSGVIKKLLRWNQKQKLKINIYNFEANSPSNISLTLRITSVLGSRKSDNTNEILSPRDVAFLKKLGFLESEIKDSDTKTITKVIKLEGKRYLPKLNTKYPVSSSLSKDYEVTVKNTYDTTLEKSKKIALTPIVFAGDTIYIGLGLGAFPVLVAIAIPTIIIGCIAADISHNTIGCGQEKAWK